MLIGLSKKSITQRLRQGESEPAGPAITDSARPQPPYTVGKTIPEGVYSAKVRTSASSSEAGTIGESICPLWAVTPVL